MLASAVRIRRLAGRHSARFTGSKAFWYGSGHPNCREEDPGHGQERIQDDRRRDARHGARRPVGALHRPRVQGPRPPPTRRAPVGHSHCGRGRGHGLHAGRRLARLTDAEEKALAERYEEEIRRNFAPESQVRAMDREGLDFAILFPTSAMYVTAFDTMDPRFAAAACRAYNDWLHDYIQAADPRRMFGAAAVSPHDVESPVADARAAVPPLGMKAVFLRPNIYNERPLHDRD